MSYIQNYSQTFCDNCYLDPDYSRQDGINTNMSVKNCNFPKNMYTYFKKEVEPKKYINGYNILNPSVRSENIDKSFSVINSDKCKNSSCIGETYITDDPRLNHVLTGTLLQLDSPPQTTYTDINTLNNNVLIARPIGTTCIPNAESFNKSTAIQNTKPHIIVQIA